MSLLKKLLLTGGGGGGAPAIPIFPMEYLFLEGTSSPYNIYYDDALGSGKYLVAQTEAVDLGFGYCIQNKLVRMSDGTLYACYSRQVSGKYQVYVKSSSDDGATWGSEVHISNRAGMSTQEQETASIAVDSNDHLHIVWRGKATGYAVEKCWYRLYDGSWQAVGSPLDIGVAGMEGKNSYYPFIAIDSNDYLHVAFNCRCTAEPYPNIWYVKYVTSWSTPVRISVAAGMDGITQGVSVSIAIDSNDYVYVVFYGNSTAYSNVSFKQIFMSRYDGSWSCEHVSKGMSNYYNGWPDIAIDASDNIHVVYWCSSFTHMRVYYNKYVISWSNPATLISDGTPTQTGGANWYSTISIDADGYINIIYRGADATYGADKIWHAQYITSWLKQCLQTTGKNQQPTLRWSRYP